MRIISKFKDYYDSVQGLGQDQELLYVREPVEIDYSKTNKHGYSWSYPFPIFSSYVFSNDSVLVDTFTVGYCGKIFHGLRLYLGDKDKVRKVCYKLEDVDAFMESNLKKRELEDYYDNKKYGWSTKRRKTYVSFFEKMQQPITSDKLFTEHHCPVFVGIYCVRFYEGRRVVYNGCLRDVEFFRVVDPYTAFQDISMYLGSLAVPQKEIPKVSDEVLAEIKGFDKWSFRKEPKQ